MIVAWFGIILLLVFVIVFTLLLVTVFSPKMRGPAIGLLLMLMFGGFALVLVGYFVSFRRVEVARRDAMQAELRHSERLYEARARGEILPFDATKFKTPQGAVVIEHPSEGMVEVVHANPTAAEISSAADMDTEVLDAAANAVNPIKATLVNASEDVVVEDAVAEDAVAEDAVAEDAVAEDAVAEDAVAEDAVAEDAVAEDAVAEDAVAEDAVAEDAVAEDAVAEDAVAEDAVAEDAVASTATIHDHAIVSDSDVSNVELQAELPEWVKSPPQMIDGRPAIVVVSDKFETAAECEQNLKQEVQSQVMRYAWNRQGRSGGPRAFFPLSEHDLEEVTRERHIEVVSTSVGPMKQIHQLIVFDRKFDDSIQVRFHRAVVSERLAQAGVMSGGVLVLLTGVFGVLKVASRPRRKRSS